MNASSTVFTPNSQAFTPAPQVSAANDNPFATGAKTFSDFVPVAEFKPTSVAEFKMTSQDFVPAPVAVHIPVAKKSEKEIKLEQRLATLSDDNQKELLEKCTQICKGELTSDSLKSFCQLV